MNEPRSVIVKTLVVDKESTRVFEFFSNLKNWESGGAIKNSKKIDDDWWEVDTPLGKAKIRIRPQSEMGIFDHDFIGGGGEWTVYCRVTPNERGSTVSWLFIRPKGMPQEEFERQLGNNFDREMEGYKKAIESAASFSL
ncbi:MAG TPA: hypothetical protein VJN71_11485 [Nitrososphaerales archaeon]|nr:hypothetical protein [Nitrososphaerales archaeon]